MEDRKSMFYHLNILTLISMLMIYTVHFFNVFKGDIDSFKYLMNFLRGFSLVGVLLSIVSTSYVFLEIKKDINYKSILLYLIIPTLFLTESNVYLFHIRHITYDLQHGFSGSWYINMYLGVILCLPFISKLDKKMPKITLVGALCLWIGGFYLSIINTTSTLLYLGSKVFIPYLGLTYLLYYFIFKHKKIFKFNTEIIIMIITMGLEIVAYAGLFDNRFYITSYFSPITLLYAVCFTKVIFQLPYKKYNIRKLSQTSYFFYFTHYYVIRTYIHYLNIENHIILGYIVGLLMAYVLAYIIYELYSLILKKVLFLY